MERSTPGEKITASKKRTGSVGRRIVDLLFEPPSVIVATVHSNLCATEADVDNADLMRYYLDHPETDRDDLLVDHTNTR